MMLGPARSGLCVAFVALAALARANEASADAARGRLLAERSCAQCHALEPGQASANPKAPAFSAIAEEPSATEYSLRIFLQTTHQTMPNFILVPDDIEDLVGYIRSLKTRR